MKKKAEEHFKKYFCNPNHIWAHKWADGWCPRCNQPVGRRITADPDEEYETVVDFLCYTSEREFWVEVKWGESSFSLSDIRPKQWDFAESMLRRGVDVLLFLVLGKFAKGEKKHYFLVDFPDLLYLREIAPEKLFSLNPRNKEKTALVTEYFEKDLLPARDGVLCLDNHWLIQRMPEISTLTPDNIGRT